ncbi:MAG: hypothetical protein H6747_08910 [Deltaproteobacteria bacterium]|nr:hypothetical protein [Deltaproteobacteria bacterium]
MMLKTIQSIPRVRLDPFSTIWSKNESIGIIWWKVALISSWPAPVARMGATAENAAVALPSHDPLKRKSKKLETVDASLMRTDATFEASECDPRMRLDAGLLRAFGDA